MVINLLNLGPRLIPKSKAHASYGHPTFHSTTALFEYGMHQVLLQSHIHRAVAHIANASAPGRQSKWLH